MQVHITGRHVEITDGIKEHVYDKVERTLVEFPRAEDVRIVIELQKQLHHAEVIVKGKDIHAEGNAVEENMFKAIDEAIVKAEKHLRKLREKMLDHHK